METIILAIKDRAVNAFQQPFTARAKGEAIRSFQDAINNTETAYQKHADDYDLYMLATYNDETGRITPLDEPELITQGKQLRLATGFNMTVQGKN